VFDWWDYCRSRVFMSADFKDSVEETANMTSTITSFADHRPHLPFLHSSGVREAALIAELNDLLQLDYDAIGAYTLAISALRDRNLRNTLIGFRKDHERHIAELVELIRARGGIPLRMPHFPTGIFKLLVQAAGSVGGFAGGDRAVLLAFVANETQARDKYRRHANASDHPGNITAILERAARDEETHHRWAWDALGRLGTGRDTIPGRMVASFAFFHGSNADIIEAAGKLSLNLLARSVRGG
jgi:rubrerythrin